MCKYKGYNSKVVQRTAIKHRPNYCLIRSMLYCPKGHTYTHPESIVTSTSGQVSHTSFSSEEEVWRKIILPQVLFHWLGGVMSQSGPRYKKSVSHTLTQSSWELTHFQQAGQPCKTPQLSNPLEITSGKPGKHHVQSTGTAAHHLP